MRIKGHTVHAQRPKQDNPRVTVCGASPRPFLGRIGSTTNARRVTCPQCERGISELESLLDAIHGTDRPATLPNHPGNGTYKEGK